MENKKTHILIADGNAVSAKELQACLQRGGYAVDGILSDGIDAAAECLKNPPDIIFLDDGLGFVDGYRTASCIRVSGYSGMIILLSESYNEGVLHKANECGIDGCVVKPVEEKFLLPWLQTKLKRANDIRSLSKEKENLLLTLENNRFIEEANGIIASSKGVSPAEADRILSEKADEKNMAKEELARIFVLTSVK